MKRALIGRTALSLSTLGEAAVCVGSVILPRMDGTYGDEGSALHDYTRTLIAHGRGAANAELPRILDRWGISEDRTSYVTWRAQRFEPDVPSQALCEQALCLMEDGSVVEVAGGRGHYDMPADGLVAGTIDVLFSDPEPLELRDDGSGRWRAPKTGKLWAPDWKSGAPENVTSIERNWQVRGAALLAGRYLGVPTGGVVPALCFLPAKGSDDPRGTWRKPERSLDESDLAEVEEDIRELVARVRAAAERYAEGGVEALIPSLRAGPHCRTCPARLACPAFEAEARALARALLSVGETFTLRLPSVDEIDDSQAARLLSYRTFAQKLKDGLDRLLQAHVLKTGRALTAADREWGPIAAERKAYDPQIAFTALVEVLSEIVDREQAEALANEAFRTSDRAVKEAARRALITAHGEVKRGAPGRLAGRIFGRVKERGGVRALPVVRWGFHHAGEGIPVRSLDPAVVMSTNEDVDEETS